jgi:hypothetical protein
LGARGYLRDGLEGIGKEDCLGGEECRSCVNQPHGLASTLIAGLERARDGALLLEQEVDWMPIRVSRRVDNDPDL